MKEQRQKKFR